ncbi:MAG TPA: GntP family permease, partial [Spirochaetota bacterium]|nr:GntP family permease [Spirochaetota bacterium]
AVMIGATFLFGFMSGMPLNDVLTSIRSGFGSTAGYIGLVIIEGIMMGIILEKTGALSAIASAVVKKTGRKRTIFTVNIAGYILSVPVSSDSGFILLHPLAEALASATGRSLAAVSTALATGLYVAHSLIPPTPGPLSATGILNAGSLSVFFLGIFVSIPGVAAGYFWIIKYTQNNEFIPVFDDSRGKTVRPYLEVPSLLESVIPLSVPVILMILRAIAVIPARPFGNGAFSRFAVFAGDPVFALFAGILCSLILVKRGFFREATGGWIAEGVRRAAPVLVISAAGGAFGAVVKTSALTNSIVTSMCTWQIGIFLPFLVAAVLKTATGSSTISIITAASVISPLMGTLGINPALAVLAVGAGSMMVSHVNDPFFWIVSKFSGMDEATALKMFTPATAITGSVSFLLVALLSLVIK